MESLKSFHDRLKNLHSQAKKLIKARLALNSLFVEEEIRQKREDEVSILMMLRCTIVKQLQELKRIEISAILGHSEANLTLLPAGLALTAMFSKNNLPSAIKDYLLHEPGDRRHPFGTVMVRVGPRGCPTTQKPSLYLSQPVTQIDYSLKL
jgi:hypothetical protein